MLIKRSNLRKLGAQIRFLREQKGYTQEGFAAKSGLDRAYYGGIERGERNVSALNLLLIAVNLGVEAGDIFPSLGDLEFEEEEDAIGMGVE